MGGTDVFSNCPDNQPMGLHHLCQSFGMRVMAAVTTNLPVCFKVQTLQPTSLNQLSSVTVAESPKNRPTSKKKKT